MLIILIDARPSSQCDRAECGVNERNSAHYGSNEKEAGMIPKLLWHRGKGTYHQTEVHWLT